MSENRTVYSLGASHGRLMGAYLSVMFVAQSVGLSNFAVLLAGDLMMLGVPFLTYRLLVRDYDRYATSRQFAAIWLNGIITFLCSSLILALTVYVFLRFIQPDFLVTQVRAIAQVYRQFGSPEASQMADMFDAMVDKHQLPTPIYMAFVMIWVNSFAGSMLSMVIAAIIRYITRRRR